VGQERRGKRGPKTHKRRKGLKGKRGGAYVVELVRWELVRRDSSRNLRGKK